MGRFQNKSCGFDKKETREERDSERERGKDKTKTEISPYAGRLTKRMLSLSFAKESYQTLIHYGGGKKIRRSQNNTAGSLKHLVFLGRDRLRNLHGK